MPLTYNCRITTEDVEGDPEDWRFHLAQLLRDNAPVGVVVGGLNVRTDKPRVVMSLSIEASSGQRALQILTQLLARCTAQDDILLIRRIAMYPEDDQRELDAEWHESLDEYFEDKRGEADYDAWREDH